jgi:ElaB/YqjD/DUF883 family membrane-anchored ribosome-binding protein
MNQSLQMYDDDDDARYRSLEAYHNAREAQANAVQSAVDFVRERPGTCLAIGAIALLLVSYGRSSRRRR